MNRSMARFNLASYAIIGAMLALNGGDAVAQSTAAPQAAADNQAGLSEIVVTAQRRSENLQRVPVTVSALTSASLENANITTGTELGKLVPALTIQPNSQSVLLFLRGIGSNVSAIGSEASVAFYVDGVYYSRLFPGLVRLNNVERVEVLKGPQGTLYGRNSSGGLVNIITRDPKPGDPIKADLSVGYGNYRTFDASAYVAASLSDTVAVDLSGVIHDQGKGFGRNIFTGDDVVKDKTEAVRGKIVFQPSDDTTIKLTGEYVHGEGDFSQSSHFRQNRQGFIDNSAALPTLGFFDTNLDYKNHGNNKEYGGSLRVQQDMGFAELSNTLAYHHIKQFNGTDADLSPANLQPTALSSYGKELLNDLQLTSKSGSPIDWNLGLFYTDQKQGYQPADIGLGGAVGTLSVHSNSRVRSIAGYGQARFPITDRLKGTIGARYTHDRLTGNGYADFLAPSGTTSPSGGVVAVPNFIPLSSAAYSFNKATFKGVLDYQFSDAVFGYASFSRGYKGATFNVIPFSTTPAKPETLDAYEVGLKTELFDRRLRLNLAGFHYELKNPQVIVIPNSGAITTENAGAAKVDGGEVEITAVPVRGLNIRASATYLHARYTDYGNAALYTPNPVFPFGNLAPISGSAKGNRLPYAPKFSGNLGGDYTADLGSGKLTIGGNIAYSGVTYFHPDNRLQQKAQALVDTYVQYAFGETGFSAKVYAQNITNQKYYTGAVEFGNAAGDLGFPAAPRTYGVTLRYKY